MKPLHAQWVVDFYNEMTTSKGSTIIESGWRAAGISDAIRLGSKELPPTDPFSGHRSVTREKRIKRTQTITSNMWIVAP